MNVHFITRKGSRRAAVLISVLLFAVFPGFTQTFNLQLRLKVPAGHVSDSLFVAGNFNEWNPGSRDHLLTPEDSIFFISLPLKKNVYEFKFTRGNWATVEALSNGATVNNHLVALSSDTIIDLTIEAWQDDFAPVPKKHTASKNVRLMDSSFYMPQLDRYRRIWIYLPEGYRKSSNKTRYPVLYMHDGQNIFDDYTSGYGEWGVDECLDSLIRQGKPAAIVVGIECGPHRMTEYNPYDFEKFGEGEGEAYVDFIIKTLKPYIDKRYRTKRGKEHTLIAGSSMGGLISYYSLLTHPNTFSKAGVFSPAFWTAPSIKQLTDSLGDKSKGRIFFYMGGLEGGSYVADMKRIAENIGKRSDAIIYALVDPQGRHNEQFWRKWFAEFYTWIMSDGYNSPVKIRKTKK